MQRSKVTITFPDFHTKHLFLTHLEKQLAEDKVNIAPDSFDGEFASTDSFHINWAEEVEL
jgi:hypothetical protein